MIFLLLAVKVVQAIELGGFDVDMGTGSFEDDSSWDQEETTGGTTSSDNDNYDSNNNWSNTEDSWNTGDDSSGAGAGSYTTGNTNTAQPETDWNDFFSADSYEDGTSNNNTVSQNNSSETARAADHQNSNDTLYNIENTEQQIADISPTPIPSPTPTMTPIPSISPTPTPVSEIQKNILTVNAAHLLQKRDPECSRGRNHPGSITCDRSCLDPDKWKRSRLALEEQQDPAETEPTGNADRNRDSHNVQERIVMDGSKKECYTNV